MGDINWLSFAISMVMPMIVGSVYYHKKVVGTAWMDTIGMTEEKAQKANMAIIFGVSLTMSALLTFFLLVFNNDPGQEGQFDTFQHGAFHGAFVGLIIAMPVMVTNALFEQRSWKYMLINIAYWVITLALMGGVVDAMNHWPN